MTVAAAPAGYRPQDATQGALLIRTDGSDVGVPAPVLHTDVSIAVTGILSRATVRQRFLNPGDEWAEGVYVFPLPESAAVDHMRMWVGDRVIEGQIKERGEAKRTYERAKSEGKRASLVEQERPNIFTTSVANIAPLAEITVEIEYQETLRYTDGAFSLRFPLVVAPRFIPGSSTPAPAPAGQSGGAFRVAATDRVPDATRITPAVRTTHTGTPNPVSLVLDLDPGMPLASITCASHPVEIVQEPDGRCLVALREGDVPADRDFELRWAPAAGREPRAAVFTEQRDDGVYALCMILPPQPEGEPYRRLPREMVFVIDTSGSMEGDSLAQARRAVLHALARLEPGDSFNVIQFNSTTSMLFPESWPATTTNLETARVYVNALTSDGGTDMRPAIEAALANQFAGGAVRQVLFLTDGAVGNEDELFGVITNQLGNSRLFTVGIGSAPNSHFMQRTAQFGRGTYTFIGNTGEVEAKMLALLQKLERPALSDIEIDVPGSGNGELLPDRIPDLYAGEPIILAARFHTMPDSLALQGRLPDRRWFMEVDTSAGESRPGIAVLWARRKIATLMDQRHNGVAEERIRPDVIAVALQHHLVSKYTSLVAVDVTPVRPTHAGVLSHDLKTNLPANWDASKVLGLPQTATPAPLHLLIGGLALLAAIFTRYVRRCNRAV